MHKYNILSVWRFGLRPVLEWPRYFTSKLHCSQNENDKGILFPDSMKHFLKWLLAYSISGLSSALVGYAIETKGEMVGDWWLALLMLPITTLFTFFTLGIFYSSLGMFVLASGSLIFIGSSMGYALKRTNIWLYGVVLGSIIVCWRSITVFFNMMSV